MIEAKFRSPPTAFAHLTPSSLSMKNGIRKRKMDLFQVWCFAILFVCLLLLCLIIITSLTHQLNQAKRENAKMREEIMLENGTVSFNEVNFISQKKITSFLQLGNADDNNATQCMCQPFKEKSVQILLEVFDKGRVDVTVRRPQWIQSFTNEKEGNSTRALAEVFQFSNVLTFLTKSVDKESQRSVIQVFSDNLPDEPIRNTSELLDYYRERRVEAMLREEEARRNDSIAVDLTNNDFLSDTTWDRDEERGSFNSPNR